MSGDVQPRKRKDKRRKKETGSVDSIYEPEIIHRHKKSESDHKNFDLPDQGEKIHVQNEHGIGGNICVKIIFFCLFGLLAGAVGLIYLQSQGSTDVSLPTVEESRFTEYFTGWLDDSTDDHENDAPEKDVDNELDEHEENDEHDEQEEHEDDDHEKDQNGKKDSIFKLFGLQTEEEKEQEESEETGIKDDKDEEYENSEEKEEYEDEENIEENNDGEDSERKEEEEEEEEDDDDDDDASQIDENDEDEQKLDNSEEDDEMSEENKYGENDVDNDDDKEEEEEKEAVGEKEKDVMSKEEDDEDEIEDEKTHDDDLGYDEIYESEEDEEDLSKSEDKEEGVEASDEGLANSKMEEEERATFVESISKDEDESAEEESGGVAVKLGVGIALVIVAHLVLVQKWKSMSNTSTNETAAPEIKTATEGKKHVENLTSEGEPVISRRQTLVPENVFLSDECEEQEEEELEDELGENDYSEEDDVEEEKVKKVEDHILESFEKLSWDDNKELSGKEHIYNEDEDEYEEQEEEEEEEYEGEEEEVVDEDEGGVEEEYEEDMEEEVEDEYEDKRKKPHVEVVEESTTQEVKPEEAIPTAPPRTHKGGKGPQDFDEDFVERFEEASEMEEIRQGDVRGNGVENMATVEEPKPIETKPGNEDYWAFKEEFDFADEHFENNPKAAVRAYEKILSKKPTALRALIGRARALDHLAEKEKSNIYLKQAINAYKSLSLEHGHLLDNETFVNLSERCIDRIRFSGAFSSAIDIHKALIKKFPQTPKYRNALAVTYLMLNKIPPARAVLNETLTLWPEDGLALVHYGFILKASDNNLEEGAKKLVAGIQTKQKGVMDGFFFCHLGDALNRLGRGQEAMRWYEEGVKEGLFLSKYQRSLYNVNRLKAQPWWTKEETTYQDFFRKLEQNWHEIRKEGLELLKAKGVNLFKLETENLTDTGDWRQLDLYFRGRKQATCNKAPITCGLVSSFKPASTCTRGQIKFSVMFPDTHVWPHCGPTNCRLRSHLGLVVPKKTYIRVAEETRSWEEGKFIIFDDSFEHEVWHNGTGLRLVLIVDVWHPELTNHERLTLSPI